MESPKILGAKASCFQQTNSQGISQRQMHGSAGSRCQIVGTCLGLYRCSKYKISMFGHKTAITAYHCDQFGSQPLSQRNQYLYFMCISTLRDAKNKILLLDHAQFSMDGICRMHKQCRCNG